MDYLWAIHERRAQTHDAATTMVLPSVAEKKFTEGHKKMKICVTGAGGFIASHLSKRLKEEGHFIRAVDWKENEYMPTDSFCDEFVNLDLRWPENCKKAVEGCDWCFNLAVRRRPATASGLAWRPPFAWRARRLARLLWTKPSAEFVCSPCGRRTWVAWASSSPTTRVSSSTPP